MFNWFSFLTYAVITAVTPGPNNIMSMTNGSRKGFRAALPFNLGIWIGFSIVMLLCTALCQLLGTLIPRTRLPMLLLGLPICCTWPGRSSAAAATSKGAGPGKASSPGCFCSLSMPRSTYTA